MDAKAKAYYKKLKKEKIDLEVKDAGEYFGGTKFTQDDKNKYQFITSEMKRLSKLYPYI